jgi:single-strand DNA-binding protein
MNSACFAGRLGRDAETKQTNNSSVTNFPIAVDVGWGDNKRTLWVSAAMWGERGEKVAQYLTKGTAVTVVGDVDLRQYEKRDGTAGAELTLNVQRLTLQGSREGGRDKSESPTSRSGDGAPPSSSPGRQEPAMGSDFEPDEALPF